MYSATGLPAAVGDASGDRRAAGREDDVDAATRRRGQVDLLRLHLLTAVQHPLHHPGRRDHRGEAVCSRNDLQRQPAVLANRGVAAPMPVCDPAKTDTRSGRGADASSKIGFTGMRIGSTTARRRPDDRIAADGDRCGRQPLEAIGGGIFEHRVGAEGGPRLQDVLAGGEAGHLEGPVRLDHAAATAAEHHHARPAALHGHDVPAGGSSPRRIDDDAADRGETCGDERDVGDHLGAGDDLDWLSLCRDRGAGVERGGEAGDGRIRHRRAHAAHLLGARGDVVRARREAIQTERPGVVGGGRAAAAAHQLALAVDGPVAHRHDGARRARCRRSRPARGR